MNLHPTKKFIVLLLLMVRFLPGAVAQGERHFDLQFLHQFRDLGTDLSYAYDPSGGLTASQAITRDFPLSDAAGIRSRKVTEGTFYCRFTIANNSMNRQEVLLFIGKAVNYELYQASDAGKEPALLPGPRNYASPLLFNDVPYSPVTIPAHSSITFLVKPDIHFYNRKFFDPTLVDPEHRLDFEFARFFSPYRPFLLLAALQLGVLLAMGLFAGLRHLATGRTEYLYLSVSTLLFTFSFGMQAFAHFSFDKWFFFTETFRTHLLEFGGAAFLLIAITRLMDLRRSLPDLGRLFKVLIGAMGLFILIDLFLAFSDARHYMSVDSFSGMEIFLLCSISYAVLNAFRSSSRVSWFLLAGAAAFFIPGIISFWLGRISGSDHVMSGAPEAVFMSGTVFLLFSLLLGSGYKSKLMEIDHMKAIEALRLENEKGELERYRIAMDSRDKERQRMAQQIHDEIGSGLTSIRLHSEIGARRHGLDWKPDFSLISSTTDKLLDKMNEILWTLNSRNDSLSNLVSYLRHQIVEFCEPHHIDVKLIIPERLPDLSMSGPVRRNILLSVREALHNIVHITHGDRVEIEFIADRQFTIVIRDNGLALGQATQSGNTNELRHLDERLKSVGGAYSAAEAGDSTQQLRVPFK